MYKYKCLNNIAKVGLDNFSGNYVEAAENEAADCILVRSAKMHEMEFDKELKAVARAGAGVNNIPLDRCAEEGIVVFNTPGANANGVKELVIFALIASVRDIIGGVEWVRSQNGNPDIAAATEKGKKAFVGNEIEGKTLAVIGLGAIGAKVANACLALGMDVKGYDAYLSENSKKMLDERVKISESLDEAIKDADFITLHVPALDSTKGMVDKALIAKMKDGAVIVNAARDLLVNEPDLAQALEEGKLRKYVCDFPTAGDCSMKNAIIIPHLGASTEESEDNCAVMAVKELVDFMENGNIINSVNYPGVDLGKLSSPRIAVLHKADAASEKFEETIKKHTEIVNSASNTKGGYAYSLYEVKEAATEELLDELENTEGALKARGING